MIPAPAMPASSTASAASTTRRECAGTGTVIPPIGKRQVSVCANPPKQTQSWPVPTANPKQLTVTRDRLIIVAMGDLFKLIWWAAVGLFRPRSALQAEILVLRHQLNVLR